MATMDSDWGTALKGYLDMGEKLSQDIEDAENAKVSTRGPSSSALGSQATSLQAMASQPEIMPPAWWARALLLSAHRLMWPQLDLMTGAEPLTVVSACAGCSAESFALKARPDDADWMFS